MCPICFASAAWIITSGASVLGATAGGVTIVRDKKISTRVCKAFRGAKVLKIQERTEKGEIHGQDGDRHAAR